MAANFYVCFGEAFPVEALEWTRSLTAKRRLRYLAYMQKVDFVDKVIFDSRSWMFILRDLLSLRCFVTDYLDTLSISSTQFIACVDALLGKVSESG